MIAGNLFISLIKLEKKDDPSSLGEWSNNNHNNRLYLLGFWDLGGEKKILKES